MNKVVIIGGGTAGYMAAAFFNNKGYDVTIIYDNNKKERLVVGESLTANTFYFLEQLCGFTRKDWMLGSDAVFKNGILYKNWAYDNERFFNTWEHTEVTPFSYPTIGHSYYKWAKTRPYFNQLFDTNKTYFTDIDTIPSVKYFDSCLTQNASLDGAFGIQLDAVKLSNFIETRLKDSIKTLHHTITEVVYKEQDVIKLVLDDGSYIDTTDTLIIDASGFSKVIISTHPQFKEESLSDITVPNRALLYPYEYDNKKDEMKPRTSVTRVSHGWIWNMPNAQRVGAGYVFNSNYSEDNEIILDFCKSVNHKNVIVSDVVKHGTFINFPSKRTKDVWLGNILSIGMSSGFIEPMEAPALLGVQFTLQYGIHYFKDATPANKKDVNNKVRDFVLSMCDFILLRYKTAGPNINSKFWDYVNLKAPTVGVDKFIKATSPIITHGSYGPCMPPLSHNNLICSVKFTDDLDKYTFIESDTLTMYEYLERLQHAC